MKYRQMQTLQSVLGTLRSAVVAMIASAGVLILKGTLWNGAVTPGGTNWPLAALFVLSFVLLRRTKWNPIAVMVLAGAMN